MLLMAFIIGAFLVMQPIIIRGIQGRWKAAGDALGSSRLYDPDHTLDCRFDSQFNTERWYNFDCFEQRCDCYTMDATNVTCQTCIVHCADETPLCSQ